MRVGVRVPLILERQAAALQRAIRTDFDHEMQVFVTGGEVRVPMPSIVVSGRKPDSAP